MQFKCWCVLTTWAIFVINWEIASASTTGSAITPTSTSACFPICNQTNVNVNLNSNSNINSDVRTKSTTWSILIAQTTSASTTTLTSKKQDLHNLIHPYRTSWTPNGVSPRETQTLSYRWPTWTPGRLADNIVSSSCQQSMETFQNWVDPDLKVDAAVPIFVKDAEDLFNEDLRPQNKPLFYPFLSKKKKIWAPFYWEFSGPPLHCPQEESLCTSPESSLCSVDHQGSLAWNLLTGELYR